MVSPFQGRNGRATLRFRAYRPILPGMFWRMVSSWMGSVFGASKRAGPFFPDLKGKALRRRMGQKDDDFGFFDVEDGKFVPNNFIIICNN
jgi:hypothetical protein